MSFSMHFIICAWYYTTFYNSYFSFHVTISDNRTSHCVLEQSFSDLQKPWKACDGSDNFSWCSLCSNKVEIRSNKTTKTKTWQNDSQRRQEKVSVTGNIAKERWGLTDIRRIKSTRAITVRLYKSRRHHKRTCSRLKGILSNKKICQWGEFFLFNYVPKKR